MTGNHRSAMVPGMINTNVRMLTRTELAEYLQTGERHVYNLERKGLPVRHVGRLVRYDLDEVRAWLRSHGGQLRGYRRELRDQARRAEKPSVPEPIGLKASQLALPPPAPEARPTRSRRRRRGRNLTHLVVSTGYAEMIQQVANSLAASINHAPKPSVING